MSEWLGALYTMAEKLRDGSRIYQPQVIMWMELPSGLIVNITSVDPFKPAPFARLLEELIEYPPDRTSAPTRIRVPETSLADEVRRVVRDIPVVVDAVPELDEVFVQLERQTGGPTYLRHGEIPPAVMGKLFVAAAAYFRAAPWKHVSEDQLVRVDIPAMGSPALAFRSSARSAPASASSCFPRSPHSMTS